ncbi:MAG: GtrA family protein [Bacteroidetes bacterium]|nr:GtrA family protein [Bacteroidota bacterium]
MNLLLIKLIKYGTVGLSGMACDFGVTYFLKEKQKINKYIANSVGFILAASLNYTLNKYWTFGTSRQSVPFEFGLFLLIALTGLLLNNMILLLLKEKWNVNFYLSKLIAIGIVFIWNFSMNYYFTFTGG